MGTWRVSRKKLLSQVFFRGGGFALFSLFFFHIGNQSLSIRNKGGGISRAGQIWYHKEIHLYDGGFFGENSQQICILAIKESGVTISQISTTFSFKYQCQHNTFMTCPLVGAFLLSILSMLIRIYCFVSKTDTAVIAVGLYSLFFSEMVRQEKDVEFVNSINLQ